jgi:hypothetical protein
MRPALLIRAFALGSILAARALAQPVEISLAGAIDFHAHSAPDVVNRSANSFAVVRDARAAGMRAVVLKNHYAPTAALAQLAQTEVGGIEVYGGVVLNRAAGGLNAEAVRRMVQVEGHRGKIVWLPTFDAENQVHLAHENRPFVAVVADGKPVPALTEIFQLCAENDLILATGHSSPAESLVILAAARAAGVKRLLVTHALSETTHATLDQMKQMAALGAVMECVWLAHLGANPVPVAECAQAIHTVGAEHFLISSDLGQANNPPHTTGLRTFIAALKSAGLTDRELALVTRENPAHLLGLAP